MHRQQRGGPSSFEKEEEARGSLLFMVLLLLRGFCLDFFWVWRCPLGRTGDCAAVRPPPGAGPGREHAPTREKSGDSLPRPIRPPWSRPAGAKQIEAKNGNGFFFPWSVLARRESWGWEGLRRPSSRGGPHTGHSTLPLECHGASSSSASPEARSPGANNDSRREVVVSS